MAAVPTETVHDTPRANVLLVDSDAHRRGACRALLKREGYDVVDCRDGPGLPAELDRRRTDAILVDVTGQDAGNGETIAQLGPTARTQNIPIIALVALDDAAEVVASFNGCVDEYLVKPVRALELAARLQSARSRAATMSELRRSHDLLGEHARNLTLLLEYSSVIATSEELDLLLTETLRVVAALTACRQVLIMLPDTGRRHLRVAKSVGLVSDYTSLTVPVGEGVAGRVFQVGGQMHFDTPRPASPEPEVYDCGFYSHPPALALAMNASEQSVGVLGLAQRIGGEAFSEYELGYLDLVKNTAASAIQNVLTRRSREAAHGAITVALASLAEHRDDDTGRHLDRMTGFCVVLAEELSRDSRYVHEIDSEFITNLRRAAPLHDIGKVAIPDHILLKPGKLSPEEWKIMRTHAAIGAATIRLARVRASDSSFLLMAEEIAEGHHEWFDGNGYPRGIHGSKIPLVARIAAVADVYDALASARVYKQAMPHAEAKVIIKSLAGRQFDPVIVRAFLAREQDFQTLSRKFADDGQEPMPVSESLRRGPPKTTQPRDRAEIRLENPAAS